MYIHIYWSGGARARPRDENFLRENGVARRRLISVCVSVTLLAGRLGAPKARFWRKSALFAPKCSFGAKGWEMAQKSRPASFCATGRPSVAEGLPKPLLFH